MHAMRAHLAATAGAMFIPFHLKVGGSMCDVFWVVFRCHNAGRGVLSYTARWQLGGCHNAVQMNIVRRACSECMCVRLLCSLFRCDHEQVVEKITPVVVVAVGVVVAVSVGCVAAVVVVAAAVAVAVVVNVDVAVAVAVAVVVVLVVVVVVVVVLQS